MAGLSRNPNMTFEIVEKHSEMPWEFEKLNECATFFTSKTDDETIQKGIRRHFASKTIARVWKQCISNPTYKVCKKRLLREFSGLV